jgi:bacillopeptidase F (M6 metalloprotease family)
MTREFDFTNVSGKIDLDYDTWYDIEKDFDYVYLLASTDGESWKVIDTPSCSTVDKTGNNLGCGYNGKSDGWIHEAVDLSQFAGEKVQLRFEYVTDAGVTGQGIVFDNISVPQLDYLTGFETDNGGWQMEGFTRIENQISQTFLVSIIRGSGDTATVEKFQVPSGQKLSLKLDANSEDSPTTLVVSGSSRYTRQKANYQLDLSPSQ